KLTPRSNGKDCERWPTLPVLVFCEFAPNDRRHSHNAKETSGHPLLRDVCGAIAQSEVDSTCAAVSYGQVSQGQGGLGRQRVRALRAPGKAEIAASPRRPR